MSGLSHGLAGDLVSSDWPRLTLEELEPVLWGYPKLGMPLAVVWHSQRPFAAAGILRCAGGTVFIKRHDPRVRSVADLREEHGFIAHLRRNGASVPAVLAARDGATAVAGPAGSYEVHALGDGEDMYRDAQSWTPARTLADAQAIGQALAGLHNAAAGYDAPVRRTRLLVAGDALLRVADPLAGLQRWMEDDAFLAEALAGRAWRAELGGVVARWHRALRPHLGAMTPHWVHGDFHASNLLWRNGRVSAVVDFGLANRTSAVFDLATAIERNAIDWLHLSPACTAIGHPELACALLRGYDSARQRRVAENRALRHVLPLVHLDFALSELAYFHGITGSSRNAQAAYGDFLLGHARWFAGADGQRFLDALPA